MRSVNRQHTTPLKVPRTRRNHGLAVLTSMQPGVCVPLAAIPMLREDALTGRMRVTVEMQETKEILMNPVNLRVTAYVVPLLALERFEGSRDMFDRSYMGQPKVEGGDVVPFIETEEMGTHGSNAVYKALGLHAGETDKVNTAYLEAYNAIWNFRAKNRSPEIEERDRLEKTLAPAFWPRSRFEHVVPDFDQAVIDGEISLNIVQERAPVKGLGVWAEDESGLSGNALSPSNSWRYFESGSQDQVTEGYSVASANLRMATDADGFPQVFAEMEAGGISVSLSNLELAKRTQAFAKLRQRYNEHDEDWIIDMLMDGLTIPDQALKQPILIADRSTRFSQVKRYATDSSNLAESAVTGGAVMDLNLRVPKLNTGGVVIVMAEAVPEQLFERQQDPFFHSEDHETWPEYLRDTLDPEKVDVVTNGEIDTDHSTPDATFGYAPMNWKWTSFGPRVGGKFYRPASDAAFDEERQRLWAVETEDPVLSEDFYLVSSIHTKPFLDGEADPFEATVVGATVITGNTVFGGKLIEATGDYDKVMEKAPTDRIEKGE